MPTRKDFESAAQLVKTCPVPLRKRLGLALGFVKYFEKKNPRFDRARFLLACGVEALPCR
jgi:hypothetical protein